MTGMSYPIYLYIGKNLHFYKLTYYFLPITYYLQTALLFTPPHPKLCRYKSTTYKYSCQFFSLFLSFGEVFLFPFPLDRCPYFSSPLEMVGGEGSGKWGYAHTKFHFFDSLDLLGMRGFLTLYSGRPQALP